MQSLTGGMQIIHNCKPMELLYQTHKFPDGSEIWMIQTLFVNQQQRRHEVFRKGDTFSFLHGTNKGQI